MTAPVTAPPGGPAVRSPRREIPRQAEDYTAAAAGRRRGFLTETTGVTPEHLGRYSFDPAVLDGNIENFMGRPGADRDRGTAAGGGRGPGSSSGGHHEGESTAAA